MAAEKLRDLSQPIDVALLDATVAAFYGTGSKEEVTTYASANSLIAFILHFICYVSLMWLNSPICNFQLLTKLVTS